MPRPYKIPFQVREGKARMLEYSAYNEPTVPPLPGGVSPWTGTYWPTEWRDNYEFDARLKYVGYFKGRSSARMEFMNMDNMETYSMTLHEFNDHAEKMVNGVLPGRWTFRKQGANYCLVGVE
jgi:hypothetical protein